MTCAFCEGDVPADHRGRYRIKEPAGMRASHLMEINGENYFLLIPIDMYILVRRYRFDRQGALRLLRCKGCWKRHQKMLAALSEDPSDSEAEGAEDDPMDPGACGSDGRK